ncbi:hypothetical protein VNO77_33330 [Canavalia gladiata]|uniref:Uncharacterized protein n=1 Tax=Canavalia gladiata TaxID=3824 RepID=A0AAN9KC74_CANGL
MTWKLVGLASSAVGLSCYAVSPSFNRLIGGWNTFKFSLYGLLSLAICAIILFAKRSSPSGSHVHLKACMGFAVLMIISVYSFFYDRAVNGKPELLSLVSNGAFALMSLSLSRLVKFGFEMGVFCFFIGCLTIQLVTIDLKLILVAIIFGCPLFLIHFSSDSHEEVGVGSQSIHSSSDSQPEVVPNCADGIVKGSSLEGRPIKKGITNGGYSKTKSTAQVITKLCSLVMLREARMIAVLYDMMS